MYDSVHLLYPHACNYFYYFLKNCGNDDDDITLVGSVSNHTSFQSGFSDTFDSNTQAFSFGKIHL